MPALSSTTADNPDRNLASVTPKAMPDATPRVEVRPKVDFVERFLEYGARLLVVAFGIFVGWVAAVIIGVVTGWIPINC